MDSGLKHKNLSDQEVDDLINKDIIELLDLSYLPAEEQEKKRQQFIKISQDRAYLRIHELLKQKDIESVPEFTVEEDAQKYFAQKGIDWEAIFAEEAIYLKAEMKTAADFIDLGINPQVKQEQED